MGIAAVDDDDDDGPSTEAAPSGGTRLGGVIGIGIGIGIGIVDVWGLMVPMTMPVSVMSGISSGDGGLRFIFLSFSPHTYRWGAATSFVQ
jgi:hypothetical protein